MSTPADKRDEARQRMVKAREAYAEAVYPPGPLDSKLIAFMDGAIDALPQAEPVPEVAPGDGDWAEKRAREIELKAMTGRAAASNAALERADARVKVLDMNLMDNARWLGGVAEQVMRYTPGLASVRDEELAGHVGRLVRDLRSEHDADVARAEKDRGEWQQLVEKYQGQAEEARAQRDAATRNRNTIADELQAAIKRAESAEAKLAELQAGSTETLSELECTSIWKSVGGITSGITQKSEPYTYAAFNAAFRVGVARATAKASSCGGEEKPPAVVPSGSRGDADARAEKVLSLLFSGASAISFIRHGKISNELAVSVAREISEAVAAATAKDEGSLNFDQLRAANLDRLPQFKNRKGEPAHSKPDGSDWCLAQWCNAVTGELGEAANIIKKIERGDKTLDEARSDLADELADVQTYLDILAYRSGVDLGEATIKKWNEVSKRVGCPRSIGPITRRVQEQKP